MSLANVRGGNVNRMRGLLFRVFFETPVGIRAQACFLGLESRSAASNLVIGFIVTYLGDSARASSP